MNIAVDATLVSRYVDEIAQLEPTAKVASGGLCTRRNGSRHKTVWPAGAAKQGWT